MVRYEKNARRNESRAGITPSMKYVTDANARVVGRNRGHLIHQRLHVGVLGISH
ncbi:hypothetical protein [Gemmiger formicilis]|uniref:hypothetical protein n=1 Tax=Gemmiger formicilis TaxID=745368 RepID=UPI003AEF54C6